MKNLLLSVFFSFCLSFSYSQLTLQDSLIAHYPMDGNAMDISGNGNHGTAFGAIPTTDRFGNANSAYQFDGIDDYMDLILNQKFKPQFPISISAWIELENHGLNMVFRNDFEENYYHGVWLNTAGGIVSAGYGDGGLVSPNSRRSKRGTTVIPVQTWTHVAVIIKGPLDMEIYINGKNDCGIYTGSGASLAYSNQNGNLGRSDDLSSSGPLNWFYGTMDDVRFYGRELSSEDIYSLSERQPHETVTICQGDDITLNINASNDPFTYSWSPASGLSCVNCSTPIANPSSSTLYQAVRSNNQSCIDIVDFQVNVENCALYFCNNLTYTLQDSLIAHYPLDGNPLDVSGNVNHGTLYGPVLTTDRFGNPNSAYQFDGIDDYMDLIPNQKFKPQFPISISAWIELKNHGLNMVFRNDFKENYYHGVWLNTAGGIVSVGFGDGGLVSPTSRRSKRGTTVIPLQTWTHVAVIIKGPLDMEIYINGKNDCGTYTGSGASLAYSNQNGNLGRSDDLSSPGPFNWYKGKIDDLRFYSREICIEEIREFSQTSILQTLNVCSGDSTSLNATNGSTSYSWSPSLGLSCTNCPNPIAYPTDTTLYQVIRDNGFACFDTFFFQVNPEMCAFTPPCDTTILDADFQFSSNGLVLTLTNASRGPDSGIDQWRWDFGDGNHRSIFKPDTITHEYFHPGTYDVCLFVTKFYDELNVCLDTLCKTVTVDSISTGFGENLEEMGWSIYPNPATDAIFLEKKEPSGKPLEIEIFTLAGKSLFRKSLTINGRVRIPIRFLAKGMYILQIEGEPGQGYWKFVKE